ncbi:MAG: hypothetical protein JSU94_13500 [Phycisphaerales bacterium]|nr:MAG: hypothetical protein JSU94_13500 [Phycisphaerales bacterium]
MIGERDKIRQDLDDGLFAGFDVGSSFVHCAVLASDGRVVYCPEPIMHFADPIGALREAWHCVRTRFAGRRLVGTAFTGSGAELFPRIMAGVPYVYDSVAIPLGARALEPGARYIFHIGAKDTYFFGIADVNGRMVIRDWKTGTKCGGGSGTLIEKQCRRLFEGEVANPLLADTGCLKSPADKEAAAWANRAKLQARLEEMFRRAQREAQRSRQPSDFLARCGVVIQSDLIHKQNEGARRCDNLAGLFRTVARNFNVDVLGARRFEACDEGEAIATGGVMANDVITDHLAELLGISVRRPRYYHSVAAIGAALKGLEENNRVVFDPAQLDRLARYSREKRQFAPPLSESLALVHESTEQLATQISPGTEVVIGIDGGSTTTKGAIVELSTGRLLDKLYIKTHGDPEASLKRVLEYLGRHRDKVVVRGVGATGSARKLYEKILLSKKKLDLMAENGIAVADRITDEITCHALGVKHNNPQIDTIFEVGGQDMKFTSFTKDGSVKEAKMNYSCQAGSGQTLENMADVINLSVETSLQEAALRAPRVPIIDSTCGVFMEMDENRLIAEGFSKDEIAAAIIRGTAASYYFKFVGGSQHVGRKCSAQGGPPLGRAFLAALAQVTSRLIEAYPHREMFGAWGQALDIIDNIKRLERAGKNSASAFRGWAVVDMPFQKRRLSCREVFADRTCGVRDCQLEVFSIKDDEIITGGFCPRGNSEATGKPRTDYVETYHRIYEKHFKRYGALLHELDTVTLPDSALGAVGVKRSTATLGEKGMWSAAVLSRLGFCPVVSPQTTKEIAQIGIDNSRTEFCIARKLATGHAAALARSQHVEYIFNPSFIEHKNRRPPNLKYCIYTESEGYVLNDVLSLEKAKQINPILHFGDTQLLVEAFSTELRRLGLRIPQKRIKEAIRYGFEAERAFMADLYAEGEKFLKRIQAAGEKAYVGIGRDYVLLDPEASSNSGAMFSRTRGLNYIPQIFLEHKFGGISLDGVAENEFWVESVKILKAQIFVAGHPQLFAIRMINFACGPDSLKIYQEERIQQAAGKPILVLVTDAQTNNAPFVTRTEAHERVVNQSKPQALRFEALRTTPGDSTGRRIWLVPYMGDASYVGAAGLRCFGVNSKVLPTNTARGYELARRHIYTEVCHPLKGVVGDAFAFLQEQIEQKGRKHVEDNYLVMLPTTSGPCRFGKYTELVRQFIRDEGLGKVPVVGPSAESDYIDVPLPDHVGLAGRIRMQKVLFKGIKAADLLQDTFLRFHPYAADKKRIENLKNQRLRELEGIVEKGAEMPDLIAWARQTVSMFKAAVGPTPERFPLVLYIGEIYMRQHDPYTDFVVHQLEDKGLEIVRDPVSDWLDYVNKISQRNSRRDLRLGLQNFDVARALKYAGRYGKSLLKGKYMERVERALAEPFHEVLHGRHVLPKPMEIIETLERNHEGHGSIEGESPLSTGIAYYFMNDLTQPQGGAYVSGIFHVGPFTCMQEGVATAKIEAMAKELRKRKPDLVFPVIHAFFGDSASANLDSEIAVFTEQCYQKKEMLKAKYG